MPAGVGIISESDQPEAATRFVEFLLSTTAQEYFAAETFEYPLVDGVEPADGLPGIDDLASPDIDLSGLANVLDDATRLVAEAGLV